MRNGERFKVFGKELTTLDLTLVIIISAMKMNLPLKIGSTIPKSSKCLFDFGAKKNARDVFKSVHFEITSTANTDTEEYLVIIQNFLKTSNIKHGNLGKGLELNLNSVLFKISRYSSGDPASNLCYRLIIADVVKFNLFYSKILYLEFCRVDGGKINEKANAFSNVKDIAKLHSFKCNLQWPRVQHIGEKLNSLCLGKNLLNRSFYHSSARDESNNLIKRQILGDITSKWPDSKKLSAIYTEVFEQQLDLVRLAKTHGLRSNVVFKRQKILFNSLSFRIVAIDKLSKSKGSCTPGIDDVKMDNKKNPKLLINLLDSIRHETRNLYSYKASPIKRVWVLINKKDLRPLGIPTLKDRALQHLLNLILDPLIEMTSEPHSFGFRPYRSAKQAILYLKSKLKTRDLDFVRKRTSKSNANNNLFELLPERKVILDASIEGFFDNINQNWILNNIFLHPELTYIIKVWLKSRAFDKNIYFETLADTLQSGIISPSLINFSLNGLEYTIMNSIYTLTKSKEKSILVCLKDGTKTRIAYVRYVDNFVVLARSKHLIKNYVLPSIKNFLEVRGLKLNKAKTKTFRLADENAQLDFLGYKFKYQEKRHIKSRPFYSQHAGSAGIALYPSKKKVSDIIQHIKFIFKISSNLNAYSLIAKLNPIIKGWSSYFNMVNSFHYRDIVRNAIYRLSWKWASRKHKRWGRKIIASKYFLMNPDSLEVRYRKVKYSKFKNRKWVFHGIARGKLRYNENNSKTIYLVDVSNVSQPFIK